MTTTEDYKLVTKKSYDDNADQFASFAKVFRGKLENWIGEFADQINKEDQILDVGCGAGRDAEFLIKHNLKVTGIDNSTSLIEIAKSKVPKAAFFVMDFEEMAMPNNGFGGIWANASLVHVPKENVLPVLKNLYELLKEDGVFYSTWRVGNEEKFTNEKRGEGKLRRFYAYYQPEDLVSLVQKAGFKEVSFELDEIETGKWVLIKARKADDNT